MAKTKISEFSSTPGNNTDIDGINIAEGCAPSGINNAIRELMSQLKDWQAGTSNDPMVIGSTGSLTLSYGTANGVAYLNGSKVLTTGSALTFDGTTFKASKAGSLGILAENTANTSAVYVQVTNTAGSTYLGQDSVGGYVGTGYSAPFLFYINNSEQMRLTSAGLGIGTSSPAYKLDVAGQIRASVASSNAQLRLERTTTSAGHSWLGASSTSLLEVLDSSFATRFTLDSSGNLGLGVTPSAWRSGHSVIQLGGGTGMSLSSGTGSGYGLFQNYYLDNVGPKYANNGFASAYYQFNGGHFWFTAPSGTAGNAISFTQALTLDANRNLLLNGTSAGASSVGTFTIFNGTAPTGSVTDGVILFAADVSSSSELRVRDEAGNVTTLSPHNFSLIPEGPSEELAWAYYSEKNGKKINVDMLKLARMVEKLTGEKLVFEE